MKISTTLKALFVTTCATIFSPFQNLHAEALYAAGPSEDAAFVRFIGAEEDLTWKDQELSLDSIQAGNYLAIDAEAIGAEPGDFITIAALDGGTLAQFDETAPTDGKSTLHFLNLSSTAANLTAGDGSIEIFSDVPSGELTGRLVNPLVIPVQVSIDGETAANLDINIPRDGTPLVSL